MSSKKGNHIEIFARVRPTKRPAGLLEIDYADHAIAVRLDDRADHVAGLAAERRVDHAARLDDRAGDERRGVGAGEEG